MLDTLLVTRVRADYLEMLGLRVTLAQACRLWQLDAATCEALLDSWCARAFSGRQPEASTLRRPPPAGNSELRLGTQSCVRARTAL